MGDSNRRKKRPIARALHQFVGQTDHELTFSPGEAILLLRRVDDNWLEGELNGSVGIFPANRVRIDVGSPSLSQDSALARSGRPFAVVLHDFPGNMEGDLSLQEGQVVELLGTVAAGWMRGRMNGSVGIFPSSFVEVVQPLRVTRKRPVPRPRGGRGGSSPPVPKPRTKKNNGRSLNDLTTNNDSLDSNHDNHEDQVQIIYVYIYIEKSFLCVRACIHVMHSYYFYTVYIIIIIIKIIIIIPYYNYI